MRRASLVTAAALLTLWVGPAAAVAQDQAIQSIGITPITDTPDLWAVTVPIGEPARLTARITNPTSIDQAVRVFVTDLEYRADGSPQVVPTAEDVGTWARLETATMIIAADSSVEASFTLTAPEGAEPGDHLGAFVAESVPEGDEGIQVVRRVAQRFVATVPGNPPRGIAFEAVELRKDSWFFTREIAIRTTLRNTGRVNLRPTVNVDDVEANGPDVLQSKSVDHYFSTHAVPSWGGPQRYRVDVTTRVGNSAGPATQVYASTWVIPWHLLALIAALVALGFAGRWVWRKKGGKYQALQADLRRIERMLSQQAGASNGHESATPADDPQAAIKAALKQARRAGDTETENKLKEKLAEARTLTSRRETTEPRTNPSASPGELPDILRKMATAAPADVDALVRAARTFSDSQLGAHVELIKVLPLDARRKLFGHSTFKPRPSRSDDTKAPTRSTSR